VIVPGEAPFPAPLILLATLLGGLPAGGLLVALNWDRLYRPDRQRRTLIGVSLGFLLGWDCWQSPTPPRATRP
jgi:hypothetical protein